MKDKKRILCNGLAFADTKDMEMLQLYAKDGWLFKEFKYLHYYLYKEEAKEIQYDYDIVTLTDDEEKEYLELCEAQGWHSILVSKAGKGVCFFWAEKGIQKLHTDKEIASSRYQPSYRIALIFTMLAMMGFMISNYFLTGIVKQTGILVSISLFGCYSMLLLGT